MSSRSGDYSKAHLSPVSISSPTKSQTGTSDWRKKDEIAKAELMYRLEQSGEKERLITSLRAKLADCGWRDEMKDIAKDVIRTRGGVTRITVDELASELLPRGRASVPENIKSELLEEVRDFSRHEATI
uniref:Transcription and mRNA export factor ENY2 n=1 Tax=Eucampia antarctica TaxID=49252 RepID=A0A7S2R8E5_9STRA|mmetsp:Transcript_18606/g.17917  ORF Transcript_18606/g.17917 Transcript_18606/m.17917 type:complete len:129 (+) Transcript_18606:69-455(+)|eukprot:CAMPEP_0197832770 /NCGR_PEP_ID=MMETSP1437-20131217/16114_1 /TAXON_ID=49252 ORGANISM="Eucampia antarctica, Strain CCMP1452" /NCGR_SAMPLE_ID=MMETSP1437 /ASSEMBLY_ACC=CAM_ASM_001096 /LENGTH=128 /DNA_ID=CAMNT_0043436345 /DNA_START=64 /DNA_END=450 /DNA_ORIENTATION=+